MKQSLFTLSNNIFLVKNLKIVFLPDPAQLFITKATCGDKSYVINGESVMNL